MLKKKKKFISKISVDSNFTFTSYAWLCMYWNCFIDYCIKINSRRQEFVWQLLLFHTEMISALIPLGEMYFLEESYKQIDAQKKSNFLRSAYV